MELRHAYAIGALGCRLGWKFLTGLATSGESLKLSEPLLTGGETEAGLEKLGKLLKGTWL